MKKLIVLSLLTLFCASTYAQETPTNSSKDSLKKEILEKLNNIKFSYYLIPGPEVIINEPAVFKNDSLIFHFEKEGYVSVNLIDNEIKYYKEISTSVYIIIIKNVRINNKNKKSSKSTLKLIELLIEFHEKELIKQRAKELDYLSKLAQTHHASSEKPTITEEQRKFIV